MDIAGKVVLVTGGGGGIGAGLAEAFAEAGAKVVITDINLDYAQAEAGRIAKGIIAMQQDVTSAESWLEVKVAVEARLGAVDILCNNAGICLPFQPMEDVSAEVFDQIMSVNVRGVFLGCKTFIPGMKARGSGHIVNTSSVNGQLPYESFAVYGASKFAVAALSEAVRDELAPHGVNVSILYPGLTRSRMSEGQMPGLSEAGQKALREQMMEPIWLGRAVVKAVQNGGVHVFPHPDHLPALKARMEAIYAAFGEPAQPGYVARAIPVG